MFLRKHFAGTTKTWRLAGLTQQRLAHRSGIDRSKLSLPETGQLCLSKEQQRVVRQVLLHGIRNRAKQVAKVLADVQTESPRIHLLKRA